ncbi:MAG: hypothetical protein KGO48_07520 [Alphaproteobacteria bacterium]|nr:hypothetical protein [Alphaproteobacteria bacterium]
MALPIETFSNVAGGNAFYKAITHPLAVKPARELVARLEACESVALYDPHELLAGFDAFFALDQVRIAGVFVQNAERAGSKFRGHAARPVTELSQIAAATVLVADFDTKQTEFHLRRFADRAEILSFDSLRLPDHMLTSRTRYLANLNFATNFAFFRDADGHHTRLTTVNYWAGYGGKPEAIHFILFAEHGEVIAEWAAAMPAANGSIVVDSAEIRKRFDLPSFTGQLFMHVVGAAGHDIVKYALDTYGDSAAILSCTHDANSWPADLYAGLPAPGAGEEVVLWVQNSHPTPIGRGEIGLNLMGDDRIAWLDREISPFATYRLSVAELLPHARWPQQIEIRAGKHFVRPRYEVVTGTRRRIAHPNVERTDLRPDANLPRFAAVLGKGFILPAPVMPLGRFASAILPTPMSTCQDSLPVKFAIYDPEGEQAVEFSFGDIKRRESVARTANEFLNGHIRGGYGHMELSYDFDAGAEADGWLHALFRFEDLKTGHVAETSFGAHVFNTLVTYKGEPQSYKGPPPGVSTRLFLRIGAGRAQSFCHLIYPASLPWHAKSNTDLILMSGEGNEIARHNVQIACGGSLLWYFHEMFSESERREAGDACYVVVRDSTCRLFGYHGLTTDQAFSLDHMFGF